jgi:hypothetical protein
MSKDKLPTTPELLGVDAALRRAAVKAKKLAEQQGVPYVIQSAVKATGTGEPISKRSLGETK